MAKNATLAAAYRLSSIDDIATALDGGRLQIYDGAQPADPDTAVTTQTVLAVLGFATPAFAPAVDDVATAYALAPEPSARAAGRAAWARTFTRAGTAVWDCTVGTADANLILPSVVIPAFTRVAISTLTMTNVISSTSPSVSVSISASASPSRSASPSYSPSASPSYSPSASASSSPSPSA